jgi:pyruvate/2-oxoglutarate dehydrogenase complex dihydrolipoamide dehydrogenase (E3) component
MTQHDSHDERRRALVSPRDWSAPEGGGRYNLVVVGAGAAGLVSAAGAAGLGARVALIEKHELGGDCLNVGCVPSKGLIAAARVAASARRAAEFGVRTGPVTVDFRAVMDRMRRLRADIAHVDSAARFRDLGVDVFLGEARFTGRHTVQVGDRSLSFSKAVLATGGRPALPPVPGLSEVGALTNLDLFDLDELPEHLVVLGAGAIGCEMAQSFARFGARVTLVDMAQRVLPREEPQASALVQAALQDDGVRLILGVGAESARREGAEVVLTVPGEQLRGSHLLVAAGRAPNVEDVGLEAAGVEFTRRGVLVDARLRTTNPDIYAAGDVTGRSSFTHTADATARIVLRNALFPGSGGGVDDLVVPRCTYTEPEVAGVGLTERECQEQGVAFRVFEHPLAENDRAILDGETRGFVRVLAEADSDRILGATIVARDAGSMISEITLAMVGELGLGTLAGTVHPYPTQAESIKRTADAFNRTKLTPTASKAMKRWFELCR